jgi:cytochrome b subunit of formate dehydrogenase
MRVVNWKTTVSGLITAAAGFVIFFPEYFARWPLVLATAKYITVGGLAALGILGKDRDVTGAGDAARRVS